LGELIRFPERPREVLPNLDATHQTNTDGYLGLLVSKKQLERFVEKVIRGVAFVENQIYIDDQHELNMYVLEDSAAGSIVEALEKRGETVGLRPALIIRRAVIPEDPASGFYAIEIWGTVKLYASVLPNHLARGDP
jgi:hypothetical protein